MTNEKKQNFSGGEFTSQIDARADTEKYEGGCRTLKNMIPDMFGNAVKRPGTEMIVVGNGAACYYEEPALAGVVGISTPQELQDIKDTLDGDYELLNDIDMKWNPGVHKDKKVNCRMVLPINFKLS